MNLLENEGFFKGDFSRLSKSTEPKMFDEEHLPLVNSLALNSPQFL